MRVLIGVIVCAVLGLVGFVMVKESQRANRPAQQHQASKVAVSTISRGEAVDVESHVSSRGYTIIEFTADF